MRANDEAGANSARALRVPPLRGEVFSIPVKRVERPGMVSEPRIGVTDPSLADGIWVEIQATKLLSYTIFIELDRIPDAALGP